MIPWLLKNAWMIGTVALILGLISFILGLTAWLRANTVARKVKRWRTIHSSADLEEGYAQSQAELRKLAERIETMNADMKQIHNYLQTKVNTVPVLRYNAFANVGSDLSFSLAMLDTEGDGAVLSSIYGREETRTYAKPIVQGHSDYALTEEEQQVIAKALNSVNSSGNLVHRS
ncbi:DUF4446 family protein [Alicyclobacillaceae bacterium I2511]|nr:DUF4446 family protein [Alicyclobacillaceae bacterium I2511]